MKWFKNVTTLDELRKMYKRMVILHHPDNGGNEEIIKTINAEYDVLFKRLKNDFEQKDTYKNATDKQKQQYDWEKDKQIREMVIKLSRFQGLTIELCGTWIYVSGNTRRYKEELKSLGLHYASKKKCWYIHWDEFARRGTKSSSMSHIRSKYGSMIINAGNDEKVLSMKAGG